MRVVRLSVTALLLGGAFAAVSASATVIVFQPEVRAQATASAHQGPHVAGSHIIVQNGQVVSQGMQTGGAVSGGPLIPGATEANAQASQTGFTNGGQPLQAMTTAHADISTGILRTSVATGGPNNFGSPLGYGVARLADTVHFTNNTGGDLLLTLSYSFDGTISSFSLDNSSSGSAELALQACNGCNIRFAGDGLLVGDAIRGHWLESGVTHFTTFAGVITPFQDTTRWITDPHGTIGAIMSTALLIPSGASSLGISVDLINDCRGADSCDFGQTGLFRFGDLPTGLSFTSASGVFLSQVGSAEAVPEPGTWAMMLLGFAAVGISMRRASRVKATSQVA